MKFINQLSCSDCGGKLEITEGFDGCGWKSEAGKDSGFNIEISLDCEECGRVYPIGRVRKHSDFSRNKEDKDLCRDDNKIILQKSCKKDEKSLER